MLSLDPLARVGRAKWGRGWRRVLAERLGMSAASMGHWRAGVPWWRADEAAVALGVHPMEVWGAAWIADLVEEFEEGEEGEGEP